MLVGYDANNVFRNADGLGEWGRALVEGLASRHVSDYRALLFSTRIKSTYKTYFTSYANVSTYVPEGGARMLPSAWMRYRLNQWLMMEKVKVFHGLNEELPYGIGRDVKTVVTCFGVGEHHNTSLMDSIMWKRRMRYAWNAADVVVAVSEEVKKELLEAGVNEQRVLVIGEKDVFEVSDRVMDQYYELYSRLSAM